MVPPKVKVMFHRTLPVAKRMVEIVIASTLKYLRKISCKKFKEGEEVENFLKKAVRKK